MQAYLRHGDMENGIAMGLQAYQMINQSDDYTVRSSMTGIPLELAMALVGQLGGQHRLDSLMAALKPVLVAPPALLARDTAYRHYAESQQTSWEQANAVLVTLGKPIGNTFVATHWLNQPTPSVRSDVAPNARVKRLDDGIIRIIGIGAYSCEYCRQAVAEMRHWVLPPGVESMFLAFTEGTWAGKSTEPSEEADSLTNWFLKVKHVKYPVAIWAGPLDTLFDGGVEPRPAPVWKALFGWGTPLFLITDGHGVVRFRYEGKGDYRGVYKSVVDLLVAERAREQRPPDSSPVKSDLFF
jgi:hypothetical protein